MTLLVKANKTKKTTGSTTFKTIKRYKMFYILVLPGILYFIIWHYIPMFGIVIAFKDISPYSGLNGIIHGNWVGFKHFAKFFQSYYFWNVMGNTVNISLQKLILGFPAPIILALLLNELKSTRYMRFVQTVSYLPHFISAVVMAGLLFNILSINGGLVNEIVKLFGHEPIHFLGEPKYFVGVLVASSIWQGVGWGTIVYLAAITGVDPELYDSAKIDGANKWQQNLYITLPSIMSIACILLILNVGGILNAGFEQIMLLYSPAVYSVSDIIDTYVYREGLVGLNYSYASAVGLFKSIVGMGMVLFVNYIIKKTGNEGIW